MCGRYTLSTPSDVVADLFELAAAPPLPPRYNIAPSQEAVVVRTADGGERELASLRWGLVPSWADDPAIGNRMINARAETAAEKPAFRSAFRRRRCLVVADGFYEWGKRGGHKQPFYFQLAAGEPFAIAGLWERWEKGEGPVETFTILTTEANELVGRVHPRMPVLVAPDRHAVWLAPDDPGSEAVRTLLAPFPAAAMRSRAVSTFVNSPANDSPRCIEPVAGI